MPTLDSEISDSRKLYHGHTVAIANTPTPLCGGAIPTTRGIMIRAPGPYDPVPNIHAVWIGRERVTPDSNEGTGGWVLLPGNSIVLPTDPGAIFITSDIDDQEVAWIGV